MRPDDAGKSIGQLWAGLPGRPGLLGQAFLVGRGWLKLQAGRVPAYIAGAGALWYATPSAIYYGDAAGIAANHVGQPVAPVLVCHSLLQPGDPG